MCVGCGGAVGLVGNEALREAKLNNMALKDALEDLRPYL